MLRAYPPAARRIRVLNAWADRCDGNPLALYAVICVFVLSFALVRPTALWFSSGSNSTVDVEPTLLQVHVIFRHGARTPLHGTYFKDARWAVCQKHYKGVTVQLRDIHGGPIDYVDQDAEALPGGCNAGQLTWPGFQMALGLGNKLRQRYMTDIPFLPRTYKVGSVSMWCTRFSRTVNTLRGVLTGLYPLAGPRANFTADSAPEQDEIMYGKAVNCPRLEKQFVMLQEYAAGALRNSSQMAAAAAKVSQHLQLPGSPRVEWTYLYDVLAALRAVRRQPRALDDATWGTITRAASWAERMRLAPCDTRPAFDCKQCPKLPADTCRQVVRHSVGRLLHRIISRVPLAALPACDHHRPTNCTARLHLYSGHDSTLTPLMAALGLRETTWPPYAGHIAVEVWGPPGLAAGSTEGLQVMVKYGYEVAFRPHGEARRLNDTEAFVPWKAFLCLVQPYAMTDDEYRRSCQAGSESQVAQKEKEQQRRVALLARGAADKRMLRAA